MEGLAENRTSDLFLQDSGNTVKGKARRKGEVLGGGTVHLMQYGH